MSNKLYILYSAVGDVIMEVKMGLHFGQLLKKIRVEEANLGLRNFAELVELQPSNLSNIERGKIPPPANKETLDRICDTLGLSPTDPRRAELFDLAVEDSKRVPADIATAIKENEGVPVLVRTVANKQLSDEKLRELAKYIEENY
jgi:transcriptional regulator with XRE-family HTH domain